MECSAKQVLVRCCVRARVTSKMAQGGVGVRCTLVGRLRQELGTKRYGGRGARHKTGKKKLRRHRTQESVKSLSVTDCNSMQCSPDGAVTRTSARAFEYARFVCQHKYQCSLVMY